MSKKNEEELVQNKIPSTSREKFQVLRFRLSTRLNDVLFPINARELADALAKAGYTLSARLPVVGARVTLHFAGEIARKNGIVIDGNSDRGVLGVTAKSYESAIDSFDELSSIVQRELNVNIDERSRFFETIADYKIELPKDPLKSISEAFSKSRIIQEASEIFQQETSMYNLRLVAKGKMPNQEEWLDITIEPDLIKPTSIYNVSVIFRSAKKAKVVNFGKELEARLLKLIKAI